MQSKVRYCVHKSVGSVHQKGIRDKDGYSRNGLRHTMRKTKPKTSQKAQARGLPRA